MEIPDNGFYKSPPLESYFTLEVSLRKQIGVIFKHLRLELPSPLWAHLMLPLNLDQVHHLVPQGLQLPIHSFHRPLNVVHAIIDPNVLQGNYNFLINHALPWLGNMEGIMNLIQLCRQLQPISYLAYTSDHSERANECWAQLDLLPELNNPLPWRYFQKHSLTWNFSSKHRWYT